MHRAPLTRLVAWLCLVAYLLTGSAGARGLVFCVGPDGHLSVELEAGGECGGCCADELAAAGELALRGAERAPEECPCVDIPLSGSTDELRPSFEGCDPRAHAAPPPATQPARVLAEPSSSRPRPAPPPEDPRNGARAHQRTVVLRV